MNLQDARWATTAHSRSSSEGFIAIESSELGVFATSLQAFEKGGERQKRKKRVRRRKREEGGEEREEGRKGKENGEG